MNFIFFLFNFFFYRRWKGDYLNDTAENQFYDAYRSALMKDGINQKSVLFSAPVKKFNRHGKVCLFVLFSKILKLKIIEIMKWNKQSFFVTLIFSTY